MGSVQELFIWVWPGEAGLYLFNRSAIYDGIWKQEFPLPLFAGLYLVPRKSYISLFDGLSVFFSVSWRTIWEKIKTKLSVGVSTRWWCSTKLFACWSHSKYLIVWGDSDYFLNFRQASLPFASVIIGLERDHVSAHAEKSTLFVSSTIDTVKNGEEKSSTTLNPGK